MANRVQDAASALGAHSKDTVRGLKADLDRGTAGARRDVARAGGDASDLIAHQPLTAILVAAILGFVVGRVV